MVRQGSRPLLLARVGRSLALGEVGLLSACVLLKLGGAVVIVGLIFVVAAAANLRRQVSTPATIDAESPAPYLEDADVPRLPASWTVLAVSIVALTLDVQNRSGAASGLRYLFLALPVAVTGLTLASPSERIQARSPDLLLGALVVWGLVGSVYGKLVFHPTSSSLALMLPMGLGLLYRFQRGEPSQDAARRILDLLAKCGALYILLYTMARYGMPLLSVSAFSKEKAFLLVIAPMAALFSRRRSLLFLDLFAIGLILLENPAATFVVTAVAVATTNVILGTRSRALRAFAILGLLVSIALGFGQVLGTASQQRNVVARYFQTVGKADNTAFRRALLKAGLAEVRRHPLVGSSFTGELGIHTNFPGEAAFAQVHNDYLQIAMGGGLVALSLYLAWVVAVNRLAGRRYRALREAGDIELANLLRVLTTGFNAFMMGSLFNPLLTSVGMAAVCFLIFGALMVACRTDKVALQDGVTRVAASG